MSHKKEVSFLALSVMLCAIGAAFVLLNISIALGIVHIVLGVIGVGVSGIRGMHSIRTYPKHLVALLVSLGVFLGLVWVGNMFSYGVDFSVRSKYSLSSGTKRRLGRIQTSIDLFHVQIGEVTNLERERELLQKLRAENPLLTIHQVDPIYDVTVIDQLELKAGDRLVIQGPAASPVRLNAISEQAVMLSIERVTKAKPLRVLYSIGHGETALETKGPLGLSRMLALLRAEGAVVEEYSLLQNGAIEDSSALFFIVAPSKAFSEQEEQLLEQFVEGGGNIFLASEGDVPLPRVFQREGIHLLQSPVVRISRSQSGEEDFSYDLPVSLFRVHPATLFLKGEASVLLSKAYPLQFREPASARMRYREELLRYGKRQKEPQQNASGGERSVTLGAVLEGVNGSRLQVISDSSWLRNRLFDKAFNKELLRGSVLWSGDAIAGDDVQVSGENPPASVQLSPSTFQNLLALFLLLAEGVLLVGVLTFWRRRERAVYSRTQLVR